MELTEEQKKIIEETITNKDGVYSCEAVAGRGSLLNYRVWYNFKVYL